MALYRLLMRAVRRIAPLVARPDSKLERGLAGRAEAVARLAAWAASSRDPERPAIWVHAPSVGEGLQAQAVIEGLRARRPDLQVAFTHFSPSAEALAERIEADVHAYLPWDLPDGVGAALDALRPDLVAFTKTEVWPQLVAEARGRGVPVALVGASVPEGAGRARWPARVLLRPTWAALALACANSEADARRLAALGVAASRVRVTGDPGIDSAAQRAAAADPAAPHLAPFHASPRPTLVAGSTWEADEAVLLPALEGARAGAADLRVIVAPHEPSAARVERLLARFEEGGWSVGALGEAVSSGSADRLDAIVVDSVGVLAHLYTVADVAYVGGGFHDDGLHSVLEPAAAGVPVVFGPRHHSARAAADLLARGGAKIAEDSAELERTVSTWLADEGERSAAGDRALAYIDLHRGAADRTARLLEALIG